MEEYLEIDLENQPIVVDDLANDQLLLAKFFSRKLKKNETTEEINLGSFDGLKKRKNIRKLHNRIHSSIFKAFSSKELNT